MPKSNAADLINMVRTWRYSAGTIVCDCPPGCEESGGETETYYRGHPVCQGVAPLLAEFIIETAKKFVTDIEQHYGGRFVCEGARLIKPEPGGPK